MPLKQVSKQKYRALYREALFILDNLCQHKKYSDHEDVAHLTLEIYFVMKRDSKIEVSLEQAAKEALLENPCNQEQRLSGDPDKYRDSTTLSHSEAQSDLDKIYLRVKDSLSLAEKYIFCMLLKDVPATVIMVQLRVTEVEFIKLKDSLIGKLRDAATSPQDHQFNSDLCFGKLKAKKTRH